MDHRDYAVVSLGSGRPGRFRTLTETVPVPAMWPPLEVMSHAYLTSAPRIRFVLILSALV